MELKEIINNAKQINDMLIQDIKDNDETVLNALSENYHEDYQKVEQDFNKALQSVNDPLEDRFNAFNNLVKRYNWKAAQRKNKLKKIAKEKFTKDIIQSIANSTDIQFQSGINNMLNRYNTGFTENIEELQSNEDFKLEFDNAIEHFDEQFAIDILAAIKDFQKQDISIQEASIEVDNIRQIINNILSQEEINYNECNRYSLTVKELYKELKEHYNL